MDTEAKKLCEKYSVAAKAAGATQQVGRVGSMNDKSSSARVVWGSCRTEAGMNQSRLERVYVSSTAAKTVEERVRFPQVCGMSGPHCSNMYESFCDGLDEATATKWLHQVHATMFLRNLIYLLHPAKPFLPF